MTTKTQTKIILYFVAILAGSWSADAAEVALRPRSYTNGSLVLLGDVADVSGGDQDRVEQLKRVELFPAPAQSRAKLMHVRELVELLILHGVDINDLEFTGTRMSRIHARSRQSPDVTTQGQAFAVEETEMVVVALRSLNRGDIIREADVELQPIDPKRRPFQFSTERRAVVGMEALTPIGKGHVISLSQLRKPLLVKRGEVIRVRARGAGVQVTTSARAMEDGSYGDTILVQSLENREKYTTYVTGLQQVEVYASGIVATDPGRPTAQRSSLLTEKRK